MAKNLTFVNVLVAFVPLLSFVYVKQYKDFKAFTPDETLRYGIFAVKCDGMLFSPAILGFDVDLVPKRILFQFEKDKHCWLDPNMTSAPSNPNDYLFELQIQMVFEHIHLNQGLLQRSAIYFMKLFGNFSELEGELRQEFAYVARTRGLRRGITMFYDEFLNLSGSTLHELKFKVEIEHLMIVVELTEPRLYDYNGFALYLDNIELNLREKASGISFSFIINMDIRFQNLKKSFNFTDVECARYGMFLINFLYRWGEEREYSVVYGANTILAPSENLAHDLLRSIIDGSAALNFLRTPAVRLIENLIFKPDDIIRHESWGHDVKRIEQLTEKLSKLRHTLHGNTNLDANIEGYWATNGSGTEENCYGFKSYWNIMQIWARVHQRFMMAKNMIQDNDTGLTIRTPEKLFETSKIETQLEFMKYLTDPCVIFSTNVSTKPYRINKTLAGVTFVYNHQYSSLPNEDMLYILEMMHLKFHNIEISFTLGNGTNTDAKAVNKLFFIITRLISSNKSRNFKYYIGIDDSGFLNNQFELFNKSLLSGVFGAHISYYGGNFSDQINKLEKLKSIIQRVGILCDEVHCGSYPTAAKLLEFIRIFSVDYIILDFDMFRAIHTGLREATNSSFLHEVDSFYGYLTYRPRLFYAMFEFFKEFRERIQATNPNITVFLRFAQPSTQHSSGLESYIKVWEFVQEVASANAIPYFFFKAFEDEDENNEVKFGWWRQITRSKLISYPGNLVDKQEEYYHLDALTPRRRFKNFAGDQAELSFTAMDIVVALSISFMLALAIVTFLIRKRYRQIQSDEEIANELTSPLDSSFLIHKQEFSIEASEIIGTGISGKVYKTFMARYNKIVAVKIPKSKETNVVLSMLREIKVMSYLNGHTNIVDFLGAYSDEIKAKFILIVTEYCEHGSLLDHLRGFSKVSKHDLPLNELYRFCEEISVGLDYLEIKHVIHGDIAARNILLGKYYVCKISDFGMSKLITNDDVYVQPETKPLPWAWTAVETLQRRQISLKTDVWSMGVTFWEIFTLGERPFEEHVPGEDFAKKILNGHRLKQPKRANDKIYSEIQKCWNVEPKNRPRPIHFAEVFAACGDADLETVL